MLGDPDQVDSWPCALRQLQEYLPKGNRGELEKGKHSLWVTAREPIPKKRSLIFHMFLQRRQSEEPQWLRVWDHTPRRRLETQSKIGME